MLSLLAGCNGGDWAAPPAQPAVSPMAFDGIWSLGLAYANSSVNVATFREQSILRLPDSSNLVSYYDENGDVRLDVVDTFGQIRRSLWIEPRLDSQLIGDGHCVISLGRSRDGRIHVMYGAHATMPFFVSFDESVLQSISPERVQAMVWPRTVSYPQFYNVRDSLQLWFRADPESAVHRTTYDESARGFPLASDALLVPGDADRVYMNQLAVADGEVALSWVYRLFSSDDLVRNEGLFLARSEDAGVTWKGWNGASIRFPVAHGALPPVVPVPDSRQPLNQTASTFGSDGRLYVTYYAQDAQGIHQIQLVIFDAFGNLQQNAVVSDNTVPFDLSGRGTLVLPLSRPQIAVSERYVHILYRQNEELVIASRATDRLVDAWSYLRLDLGTLGVMEPTFARDTWAVERRLMIFVQEARQGALDTQAQGPPTPATVYVLHESN